MKNRIKISIITLIIIGFVSCNLNNGPVESIYPNDLTYGFIDEITVDPIDGKITEYRTDQTFETATDKSEFIEAFKNQYWTSSWKYIDNHWEFYKGKNVLKLAVEVYKNDNEEGYTVISYYQYD